MAISDSLVTAGVSAATGNYVGAGLSLVGAGISLFGGISQAEDAQKLTELSQQKIQQEGQIENQKHNAMRLSARRQQLEIMRNTQRARSMGLQASVNQGAQFGSGAAGGQAQEQAMGFYNLKGVNQNLEIGENIFGINKNISRINSQMTSIQGDMSTSAGISAIGGGISKSADSFGRLAGQAYSTGSGGSNPYYGPLDYNG